MDGRRRPRERVNDSGLESRDFGKYGRNVSRGVCVITGGGRGIGAAAAARVAASGWVPCISWINDEAAAETVVASTGGRSVRADVSREPDVGRLFAEAGALGPITAVVANAGVVAPAARVEDFTVERMRRLLEVNVLGVMLTFREAVRCMSTERGGQGGSLVAISSLASRLGSAGEYVDYAATKGAVDSFVIGLAREVAGEGLRVNAVRPGTIDTEIHASGGQPDRAERIGTSTPLGRAGTADEVAAAVLWLLGPESSYTTGSFLDVGGGR